MKVYITRPIPKNAYDILETAGLEVTANEENVILTKQELIDNMNGCDVLLPLLTDPVDGEVMDSNSNLKIISNYAVGYNNIDVEAATDRGILVCNTPGVLSDTTADLGFTLLMCAARDILQADKFTRDGKFDKWEPLGFLGEDIYKATLGIIGAGRIGEEMAKRGHLGFEMPILYSDVRTNDYLENNLGAKKVEIEELLKESDFVSIHVPLLPETTHMISDKELAMMKPSAVLINTSRGPVVDEQALANALKNKVIRAAGLDVYENEPEVNPTLLELDNVILAPHIASASVHTRGEMARIAAENIVAFTKGERPQAPVNPDVLN